jgi:hypothetical protein
MGMNMGIREILNYYSYISTGYTAKWRRGRDSNPRYGVTVYTLSRRAPSTARTPLLITEINWQPTASAVVCCIAGRLGRARLPDGSTSGNRRGCRCASRRHRLGRCCWGRLGGPGWGGGASPGFRGDRRIRRNYLRWRRQAGTSCIRILAFADRGRFSRDDVGRIRHRFAQPSRNFEWRA